MKKFVSSKQPSIDPIIFSNIKAPLLILDPLWQEQFRNKKSEQIIALEMKIKDLMKEDARLNEAEKYLIRKKKDCLNQIQQLTVSVHDHKDKDAAKTTELLKKTVLDINNELDELIRNAEKIPMCLEDANRELLAETVSIIYFSMRDSQARLQVLNPEIERLRGEVQRLINEQIECEEEAARTYQLLHKMVGRDVVNILDQQFKP